MKDYGPCTPQQSVTPVFTRGRDAAAIPQVDFEFACSPNMLRNYSYQFILWES